MFLAYTFGGATEYVAQGSEWVMALCSSLGAFESSRCTVQVLDLALIYTFGGATGCVVQGGISDRSYTPKPDILLCAVICISTLSVASVCFALCLALLWVSSTHSIQQ